MDWKLNLESTKSMDTVRQLIQYMSLMDVSLKHIFFFHSLFSFVDLWHGCPNCYRNGSIIASGSYLTMHEKFQNTLDKEEKLKKMNVHMITMWECELKEMLKKYPQMKQFFDNCKIVERLNPRDAFFGGRTGPTTLYKKTEEGERIDYVDICR